MNNYLGLIQFGLLAILCFSILSALFSAAVYPIVRKRLSEMPPVLRSNVLLVWLGAPTLIGVALTALTFMPSLLSIVGFAPDHCNVHDGHLHLCLFHPPLPVDNTVIQLFLAALVGVAVIFIGMHLSKILHAYKFQRILMMASRPHTIHDINVVDWDMPLALSTGIRRIRVFISSQLIQSLSPKQLEVVIAHEQSHLSRRDPVRHLIAHTFSFTHFPWLRKNMLMDFDLATEQACDEVAAEKVGNRLYVADTILAVERLFTVRSFPYMAKSISGSNITARVESLLSPSPIHVSASKGYMTMIAASLLFTMIAMMNDFHHFTESILQRITGQM